MVLAMCQNELKAYLKDDLKMKNKYMGSLCTHKPKGKLKDTIERFKMW